MKIYFRRQSCASCSQSYDATYSRCPHCGEASLDPTTKKYDRHIHVPFWRQILFFVAGYIGLQVFVLILELIGIGQMSSTHPGYSQTDIAALYNAFLQTGAGLFGVSGLAYVLVTVLILLVFWKDIKQAALSFKNWKAFVAAAAGIAAISVTNIVYMTIMNAILGPAMPGANANQSNVQAMVLYSPVFSFLILSFLGPFCEEAAYRVGLFGFLSRFGKPLGYIISALVFGLIHFDFGCFGSSEAMIREFVNLPSYIGAGVVLTVLYDHFGFASSLTAHIVNNAVSVLQIIVISSMNQGGSGA